MNKSIIFSGIQPSGDLTLGNYISILKQYSIIQYNFNCILCIADLHAISNYINPFLLNKNILDILSLFLASGIDPNKTIIFTQSSILEHTQLYWILLSLIRFNELKRLNQFKEILNNKNYKNINSNLLTYPVLMASDILLYKTDIIIVGKDQKQHTEIIKLIIKRFNKIYGNYFKIPEININERHYIMSLLNPNKKMSKSDNNKKNIINLLENNIDIKNKIKKSITDSDDPPIINYNKNNKPGIYNLLNILSSLNNNSIGNLINIFKNKSYNFLKEKVSDEIIDKFKLIKDKYLNIRFNEDYLNEILKNGSFKAKNIAKNTLNDIQKLIGLIR